MKQVFDAHGAKKGFKCQDSYYQGDPHTTGVFYEIFPLNIFVTVLVILWTLLGIQSEINAQIILDTYISFEVLAIT